MKHPYKIILLALSILATHIGFANEDFVKHKQEKFETKYTKGMYLDLSNQYGDIEILNSTGDSIKIIADVTVNSKKEESLQTYLNNVIISYKTGPGYVLAETKWSGDVDFFEKSYQAVKSGLTSENNVKISYKVYIPKYMELNISNKFGNVFLDNHSGRLSLKVAHGDIRARDLDHVREIDLRFGKLKVNKIGDSKITLTSVKYAEIQLANSISIKSTSSDININSVETIMLDSKHDEITINSLGEISGIASLSDLKIQQLNNSIRLDAKFGSIRLFQSNANVSRIDIISMRSDVSIGFHDLSSASIELLIDDKKYLLFGTSIKKIHESPSTEASTKLKLQKGTANKTIVNIKSSKAYIELDK